MSSPFIGPLPHAELPAQPRFEAWCVDWAAYDVPRIWDIVRDEDNPRGWEQVGGFRQLSQLLVDHYRRLLAQHFALTAAWRSPVADVVLLKLESFAQSLLSDANCAMTTAHALDKIMDTYAEARVQVEGLEREWNRITSDWVPEWWDNAAADLNVRAQNIMFQSDAVVRDHRTNIIIPDAYDSGITAGPNTPQDQTSGGRTAGGTYVPPMPGYAPRSQGNGAELAGGPTPVPAIPGQPVSMLPVPPGNPYAPHGGAYILPGPGIGRSGYLVPMPPPTGTTYGRGSVGHMTATGGRAGSMTSPGLGMMPMPVGAGGASGTSGGALYRRGNTVWEVEKGVPPVIEPVKGEPLVLEEQSAEQEQAFKDWFAELAHPWRAENKTGSEPRIILRKVDE